VGRDGRKTVEVRLLAQFGVCIAGRAVDTSHWRVRKAASLVKILALTPGHRVRREQLMDDLWPDLAGPAAANNLRFALHVAREGLGDADLLRSDGASLRLDGDGSCVVDVDRFESDASDARSSRTVEACQRAASSYLGDLLPDDVYEDWSVARREQLRATFHSVLDHGASLAEREGDGATACGLLERLVASDPTDEPSRVRIMRSYAAAGERAQALRHYDLLVAALRSQLDVAPEAATTALSHDIARR
jgi:DNA-binding SARP family transcriptional activator